MLSVRKLCARHCSKHLVYLISFNVYNKLMSEVLVCHDYSHFTDEATKVQRLNKLSKVNATEW